MLTPYTMFESHAEAKRCLILFINFKFTTKKLKSGRNICSRCLVHKICLTYFSFYSVIATFDTASFILWQLCFQQRFSYSMNVLFVLIPSISDTFFPFARIVIKLGHRNKDGNAKAISKYHKIRKTWLSFWVFWLNIILIQSLSHI